MVVVVTQEELSWCVPGICARQSPMVLEGVAIQGPMAHVQPCVSAAISFARNRTMFWVIPRLFEPDSIGGTRLIRNSMSACFGCPGPHLHIYIYICGPCRKGENKACNGFCGPKKKKKKKSGGPPFSLPAPFLNAVVRFGF
eukprot:TRINITY_DN21275_c0_g1_i1.p2 TRINITY_DN21275_c0_g1~~TRINITY_DN21275_c0_g1_i1.p2  ORF type:complete len:141 (+),score=1.36 TRINITY_DN21275_c0_g1_i1:288-710(+)